MQKWWINNGKPQIVYEFVNGLGIFIFIFLKKKFFNAKFTHYTESVQILQNIRKKREQNA